MSEGEISYTSACLWGHGTIFRRNRYNYNQNVRKAHFSASMYLASFDGIFLSTPLKHMYVKPHTKEGKGKEDQEIGNKYCCTLNLCQIYVRWLSYIRSLNVHRKYIIYVLFLSQFSRCLRNIEIS